MTNTGFKIFWTVEKTNHAGFHGTDRLFISEKRESAIFACRLINDVIGTCIGDYQVVRCLLINDELV